MILIIGDVICRSYYNTMIRAINKKMPRYSDSHLNLVNVRDGKQFAHQNIKLFWDIKPSFETNVMVGGLLENVGANLSIPYVGRKNAEMIYMQYLRGGVE